MATSLFGPDLDSPGDMPELGPDAELPPVAPVRLPPESERLAAVRAAPVMQQLRTLAEYCTSPGRKLTQKGNLQLVDARHLVDALDTGDDLELGGVRKLRSSDQLPWLSRIVDLALEVGVVHRQQGRLVTSVSFAALDECAAHEKVVLAALVAGVSGAVSPPLRRVFEPLDEMVQIFTTRHDQSVREVRQGCRNNADVLLASRKPLDVARNRAVRAISPAPRCRRRRSGRSRRRRR
jgi:hypothetical protein